MDVERAPGAQAGQGALGNRWGDRDESRTSMGILKDTTNMTLVQLQTSSSPCKASWRFFSPSCDMNMGLICVVGWGKEGKQPLAIFCPFYPYLFKFLSWSHFLRANISEVLWIIFPVSQVSRMNLHCTNNPAVIKFLGGTRPSEVNSAKKCCFDTKLLCFSGSMARYFAVWVSQKACPGVAQPNLRRSFSF